MDNENRRASLSPERQRSDESCAADEATQKAESYKQQGNDEGYRVWSMIARFLRELQFDVQKRRRH